MIYGRNNDLPPYLRKGSKSEIYAPNKRYEVVINSFVKGLIKDDYIETSEQLLKGDYGFMCQYDKKLNFETVWSSIFDLESLIIHRAEGDPRRKNSLQIIDCILSLR